MAENQVKRKTIDSLYVGKSTIFKIFLLGGVVIISAVFIWYTFNVIDVLQKDTRSQVDKYVKLWQLVVNANMSGTELNVIFDEIILKANFPIIVLDQDRVPILSRNIDGVESGDFSEQSIEKLKQAAQEMVAAKGEFPLVYYGETDSIVNYFCYGDSEVINQLKMMPFIEIGIIVAFMVVAMIGFQNIRRSEERHIWVGMAKETAHQLGTPISSLLGWLEVMESEKDSGCIKADDSKLFDDTIHNMQVDIDRLQKVANRFGKIGSIPELQPMDLNSIVKDAVDYYRRRVPFEGKGITIHYHPDSNLPQVMLNAELLSWAIENMLKNALQSVDAKSGIISISTTAHGNHDDAILRIVDNGKGISSAAARKIFRAGFTTKKRGWGLGLTLVKRIIEEYHGGTVYLESSKPGETIFVMQLPLHTDKG